MYASIVRVKKIVLYYHMSLKYLNVSIYSINIHIKWPIMSSDSSLDKIQLYVVSRCITTYVIVFINNHILLSYDYIEEMSLVNKKI